MADMRVPVETYLNQRFALELYVSSRDALFRNPTFEATTKFLQAPPEGWLDPSVPLASLHRARLQWAHVTDAMIEESMQWLADHGYKPDLMGIPPFTPESRDEDRARHGWPPLKGIK